MKIAEIALTVLLPICFILKCLEKSYIRRKNWKRGREGTSWFLIVMYSLQTLKVSISFECLTTFEISVVCSNY